MPLKCRPGLFLDRDGVINVDHAYVYRQEDFDFVDGIFELCRNAKELGYLIFVVTNQAGIGRGIYTEQEFLKLTEWMCGVFNTQGVVIDKIYFCPFHPEHGVGKYKIDSPLRKPGPGMILQAAREYNVDLARSVLVGDKETDIQAGAAAGVGCNLLYRPDVIRPMKSTSNTVIVSLADAVPFLIAQLTRRLMNPTDYANGSARAIAIQPLTRAQMNRSLEALRANFEVVDIINRRQNRIVIRWRESVGSSSIIVKMWSRPDLKGKLQRLLRIAACNHEWRNLARMFGFGIAVPRPLGVLRVAPSIAGYTDALFMEDLGTCESATEHLKRLIHAGRENDVRSFENMLIEMTARIVEAGMLDVDHGMLNIAVQASGRPVKLDLELARRVIWPRLFPSMYGRMVGRLIGLHAFAVQPDVRRTEQFAARLCERLKPPSGVLKRAGVHAQEMMHKQLEKFGIDTNLKLPWD